MTKKKDSAEKAIRDTRRATRRQYSAKEKIRIVLEGLRGESSIAELCSKEGINQNLYYRWSKEFLVISHRFKPHKGARLVPIGIHSATVSNVSLVLQLSHYFEPMLSNTEMLHARWM